MNILTARANLSVSWGEKAARLVLALALILPLLFVAQPAPVTGTAQPALLTLAADRPTETVRVIVQRAGDSGAAEALVAELGGRIIKDLHIINAFAAELSARAARELAASPAVRWISLDAPVQDSKGRPPKNNDPVVLPENTYLDTLNVRPVWDMGYQGDGIGVAILDSGIATDRDFTTEPGKPFTRIEKAVTFADNTSTSGDLYGHGTHVAGIVGGHGGASGGLYSGIAPKINLINLKVSDDFGMAYESDVVAALQWVYDNHAQYNIRVVNLSLNSTQPGSYHDSPMDAAVEILWFNGIVVVAAAGNGSGNGVYDTINSAPANDPFIITVGAMDEKGTSRRNDDSVPTFSAWGLTTDGHLKPEIYAPGKDIISVLASSSDWYHDYPDRAVMDREYFRISGTSMAAPMVTGAVALMLQADPDLTPGQVKHRLVQAASWVSGWKYLDVYAAVTSTSTGSANTGLVASQLLWSGSDPVAWDSVSWNSVSWNSVSWNSVSWNSVSWNSVSWNSVSWND